MRYLRCLWAPFSILLISFGIGYLSFLAILGNLTNGFKIDNISSNLSYSSKWEVVSPPKNEIKEILSQKFIHIGRGSQCFVFESEDSQYVLKFFRYPRYRLPWFAQHLSLPKFLSNLQNQHLQKKQQRLHALFESCKLAYEELHERSGFIYLHLNKTSELNQTVTLYDSLKQVHQINIDSYEFLIQKKCELIYPYLTRLITKGKREEAEKALAYLAAMLVHRFQKGIVDNDSSIIRNSGFREGKAQYLDVGQFLKDPKIKNPALHRKETYLATAYLQAWLRKQDSQLAQFFEEIIKSENTCERDL